MVSKYWWWYSVRMLRLRFPLINLLFQSSKQVSWVWQLATMVLIHSGLTSWHLELSLFSRNPMKSFGWVQPLKEHSCRLEWLPGLVWWVGPSMFLQWGEVGCIWPCETCTGVASLEGIILWWCGWSWRKWWSKGPTWSLCDFSMS